MKKWLGSAIIVVILVGALFIPIFAQDRGVVSAQEPSITKLKNMSAGDKISFAGRTWIVLNPEEGYIFSDDSIGKMAFDLNNKVEFNPNDSNNIGHYLNQTYYEGLTTPEREVIQETNWNIGREGNESANNVTANIGLLSVDEWNAYKNVINNPVQLIWLRTPNSDGNFIKVVGTSGNTNSAVSPSLPNPAVHPVLTLDPEVFVSSSTKGLKDASIGDEFTFAEATWIVLDPIEGYILRKDSLGNRLFDSNNKDLFNPVDENNVAYYLNETFYKGLTPDEQDAIKEREWTLENESNQHIYGPMNAKVGLLSNNEWEAFKDDISFLSNFPEEWTWLRTPRFANSNFVFVVSNTGTVTQRAATFREFAVRPSLTLNPEYMLSAVNEVFFTKVTFTPNGNETWAQSHSVTVNVTNYDSAKPLQYAWSTNKDIPVEENDWTTFTNNTEITTSEGASGEHYLHVRGTTENDNLVFYDVSNAFNVDNMNPSLPKINASTEWTNNRQIGIAHGTENDSGVARTEYKIGYNPWQTWPAATEEIKIILVTEGNITIQAKTIDLAGNESEIAEKTVKIDYTPPELTVEMTQGESNNTYTNGDWTNETVNVSVHAEDTISGLKDFEIAINDEAAIKVENGSHSLEFMNDGVYELNIKATDHAGNETTEERTVKIDKTNPGEPTIQIEPDGWTNAEKVIVTITDGEESENESSIARTEYRLNTDQEWIKYENPLEMINEGETIIQARTIDNASNISTVAENTVQIDRTAPELTLLGDSTINILHGQAYVEPGATAKDNVDGDISEQIVITGEVDSSKLGEYQVRYSVSDRSGNKAVEVVRTVYVIDGTSPETEVRMTYGEDEETYTHDTWTNKTVKFFIEAKDDNEMKSLEVWIDDEEITDIKGFTHELAFDKHGLYELSFKATDQFGNETTGESTIKIDKINPKAEFATNGNEKQARSVSTTVSITDEGSGVNKDSLQYVWTDTESPPSIKDDGWGPFENEIEELKKERARGTWYLHIYAKDNAENSVMITSAPFQLYIPSSGGGSGWAPSSDANLGKLELFVGDEALAFTPSFSSSEMTYTAKTRMEKVTFSAQASHSKGKVTVDGELLDKDLEVDLQEGNNVFEFIVEAENGMKKTYTLRIHRVSKVPYKVITKDETFAKNKLWTVTLSKEVDASSVQDSLYIMDEQGLVIPATFTSDGKEIFIDAPEDGYAAGRHTLYIANILKDKNSTNLKEPIKMMFTIH